MLLRLRAVLMDMTDTTRSISMDHIAGQRIGAPHIAGTAVALTTHRYEQDEVARVLTGVGGPEFARFAQTSGVDTRSLALPLSRYPELTGFTEANDACMHVAVDLGERLASRMGFRADIKRVPLFGLGCVAGAAGMARAQHRPAVVVRGDAR